jgi:hypothetical protein
LGRVAVKQPVYPIGAVAERDQLLHHLIAQLMRPALVAPLPPLPTPDPSKHLAVVLSNNDTEITDVLPEFELVAPVRYRRSTPFGV